MYDSFVQKLKFPENTYIYQSFGIAQKALYIN